MNYIHLSFSHRLSIEQCLQQGASQSAIARVLKVHRSTVSNELKRNRVEGVYTARQAQALADERARKNKPMALQPSKGLTPAKSFHKTNSRLPQRVFFDFRTGRFIRFIERRLNRKDRYEWNMRCSAECYRRWYLSRRLRNHGMEGILRLRLPKGSSIRRRLGIVPLKLRIPRYFNSKFRHVLPGIIKGHYRNRGIWSERGLKKARRNILPYIRFEIQKPVFRFSIRKQHENAPLLTPALKLYRVRTAYKVCYLFLKDVDTDKLFSAVKTCCNIPCHMLYKNVIPYTGSALPLFYRAIRYFFPQKVFSIYF